MYIHYH